MKKTIGFSLVLLIAACNNRNNATDESGQRDSINVSDSRRNTGGTTNYITNDSSKVSGDSAQHGTKDNYKQ